MAGRHCSPRPVIAGPVPAIQTAQHRARERGVSGGGAAWIPGTSPGMTAEEVAGPRPGPCPDVGVRPKHSPHRGFGVIPGRAKRGEGDPIHVAMESARRRANTASALQNPSSRGFPGEWVPFPALRAAGDDVVPEAGAVDNIVGRRRSEGRHHPRSLTSGSRRSAFRAAARSRRRTARAPAPCGCRPGR